MKGGWSVSHIFVLSSGVVSTFRGNTEENSYVLFGKGRGK